MKSAGTLPGSLLYPLFFLLAEKNHICHPGTGLIPPKKLTRQLNDTLSDFETPQEGNYFIVIVALIEDESCEEEILDKE